MTTYAGVGYISATDEYDDIYIRHDTMANKGELITHDPVSGLSQAVPQGLDGYQLVARPANAFGMAWEAPAAISITGAASGGIESNGSGIVITPDPITGTGTLALAASGVTDGVYGSSTQVPQITYDDTGRATLAANVPIADTTFNATTPILVNGAASATAGPGDTLALSHATSGVVAGTYNAAIVTINGTGHISSASSAPTRSISGGTGISVTGGNSFYAPAATAMVINLANVITAGSAGSATSVPVITYNAQGQLTVVTNTPINGGGLGSITVTPSGPLTVSGSPVSLGGTVTITNTALNSVATQNWRAGSSITASGTQHIAVGDSAKVNDRCVVLGCLAGNTTSGNFVAAGFNCLSGGQQNGAVGIGEYVLSGVGTGSGNTIAGNLAMASLTGTANNNNTLVGYSANSLATASVGNTGIGASITFGNTVTNSCAIGLNAVCLASNCIAFGAGVSNSIASTALIGDSTAYIVRSAGQFQSAVTCGAAAGKIAADATQTIATTLTAVITIYSTRYADGGMTISGNTIVLPTFPYQYVCSAWVNFTIPSPSNGTSVSLTFEWTSDGGVTWQTLGTNDFTFVNNILSGGINVATAMKATNPGANWIRCSLTNGTNQTLSITRYRLSATRSN